MTSGQGPLESEEEEGKLRGWEVVHITNGSISSSSHLEKEIVVLFSLTS